VENYLVSFFAGLVFAKDMRTGALAGIIVGVLAALVSGGMEILALSSSPALLAVIGPRLVLAVFIFGLAGAAGGLVRDKLSR
jgi:hypothetical protein